MSYSSKSNGKKYQSEGQNEGSVTESETGNDDSRCCYVEYRMVGDESLQGKLESHRSGPGQSCSSTAMKLKDAFSLEGKL